MVVLASDPDGLPGTPVIDAGSNSSGKWWGLTENIDLMMNASYAMLF